MTIRKGEPWGATAARPIAYDDVASDAELAARVEGGGSGPFRLLGGDLWRTLGGASSGPTVEQVPIDVLRIVADGTPMTAVAHAVIKRPRRAGWWRGPITAVMNVGSVGDWDVAPRAHPNDGRADIVEVAATMGVRARWQARRRMVTGTHVPHPAIRMTQRMAVEFEFDEVMELKLDGRRRGSVRTLRVTVEPDACTVYA